MTGKGHTSDIRADVLDYARKKYGTKPAYPWRQFPDYAVLRHKESRKSYGLLMTVKSRTIGMEGDYSDILNVKVSDPMQHDFLLGQKGFLPAWHMNKAGWLSILLDGTVQEDEIFSLLDESYAATATGHAAGQRRGPGNWLIPANCAYYDPRRFFEESDETAWTQSSRVRPGDTVYIYAGLPIGAIMYRCRVLEADLPAEGKLKEDFRSGLMMRIRLECRYDENEFTRERLNREFGVRSVRGPRYAPDDLVRALTRNIKP